MIGNELDFWRVQMSKKVMRCGWRRVMLFVVVSVAVVVDGGIRENINKAGRGKQADRTSKRREE